jgi:hypothetical protein
MMAQGSSIASTLWRDQLSDLVDGAGLVFMVFLSED